MQACSGAGAADACRGCRSLCWTGLGGGLRQPQPRALLHPAAVQHGLELQVQSLQEILSSVLGQVRYLEYVLTSRSFWAVLASTVPRCRASSGGTRPACRARSGHGSGTAPPGSAAPPRSRACPSGRPTSWSWWVLKAAEGLLGQVDVVHHDLVHQAPVDSVSDREAFTGVGVNDAPSADLGLQPLLAP